MAEAQEIYRRFCAAPLRLRTKPSPPPSAAALSDSDESPAHAPRKDPATENQATEAALELLEERIQLECRVDDAPKPLTVLPRRVAKKKAPLRRPRSKAVEPAPVLSPPQEVAPKKHKRVTRAVAMVNSNTGGVCIDTPTKAAAPPKRSRKAAHPPESNGEISDVNMEDADKENVSLSRNIMDAFEESDGALSDVAIKEKPKRHERQKPIPRPRQTRKPSRTAAKSRKPTPSHEPTRRSSRLQQSQPRDLEDEAVTIKQLDSGGDTDSAHFPLSREVDSTAEIIPSKPPPVVDVHSEFCGPLLETRTTSGALFALWFSALGFEVEECSSGDIQILLDILRAIYSICIGICQCEALARSQDNDDQRFSDEPRESLEEKKEMKKKKVVRFRHFDLSTLNLSYIDDETAAAVVEELLRKYVEIRGILTELCDWQHYSAKAAKFAHIVGILNDTDRLAAQSGGKGMVASAFFSMSKFQHDEIRACQPFFSREFAKLSSFDSASSKFLEGMFSSLISSLARFRLRELFLPFEPSALLDEGEQLHIATYEHQDFGAAIHRALKETHHFHTLVAPILAVIEKPETSIQDDPSSRDEAVMQAIASVAVEDLIHVERYILASRYLRLSFGRCILLDNDGDTEACQMRANLEQLCAIAKRLHFEDEAHFFPLASIEDFVRDLERREPALIVVENALQGISLPHYDPEAPCVECNEIVTRRQQSEAISCISCEGRFHLKCLDLPLSFAQFAGSYTCPSCYLGRTR